MKLNLVLVDEEDRRYFKQQEIILWRKADKTRKPFQASLQQQYKQMQNPNVQFSNSDQSIAGSARNLGAQAESESNSRLADDSGQLDGGNGSSSNKFRSPLEQSSSSEQPTPDKEFQSVINSQENRTMSPLSADNPITGSIPPQQQFTTPVSPLPAEENTISPILESPPEEPIKIADPEPAPPQKERKKEPPVAIAVAVEETRESSSSAATEAIITTTSEEETTEN